MKTWVIAIEIIDRGGFSQSSELAYFNSDEIVNLIELSGGDKFAGDQISFRIRESVSATYGAGPDQVMLRETERRTKPWRIYPSIKR